MPGLLIWDNGSKYTARCVNTNIEYDFLGAYPDVQLANVRMFAQKMANYRPFDIPELLNTGGTDPGIVVRELFNDNDSLAWEFRVVWESEDGGSIINSLQEVGELFLEMLFGSAQSDQQGAESSKGKAAS